MTKSYFHKTLDRLPIKNLPLVDYQYLASTDYIALAFFQTAIEQRTLYSRQSIANLLDVIGYVPFQVLSPLYNQVLTFLFPPHSYFLRLLRPLQLVPDRSLDLTLEDLPIVQIFLDQQNYVFYPHVA